MRHVMKPSLRMGFSVNSQKMQDTSEAENDKRYGSEFQHANVTWPFQTFLALVSQPRVRIQYY